MGVLNGLYAITNATLQHNDDDYQQQTKQLVEQVNAAIDGGARVVQYRDKSLHAQKRHIQAQRLLGLCQQRDALFIVNDDIALAQQVGAHGVHIGSEDSSLQDARKSLGDNAIVGVSCYNRLELAQKAQQEGADYVAFGRFYPSVSKPRAVLATFSLLQAARQEVNIPIVAIGGINEFNAASLIEAGADMVAVIDALFADPKRTKQTAAAITHLFK